MKKHIARVSGHPATKVVIFLITLLLLVLVWFHRTTALASTRYGYLGIFIINFISSATIFIPVPGVASVFLAGSVLNPFGLSIVSAAGASCGELFGYLVGYGSEGLMEGSVRYRKWIGYIRYRFERAGFLTIFLYAALPLPFFDIMGILSGTLNYPVWKFALATFLGKTVKFLVIALAGHRVLPQ